MPQASIRPWKTAVKASMSTAGAVASAGSRNAGNASGGYSSGKSRYGSLPARRAAP